jgi:hypothetical protein
LARSYGDLPALAEFSFRARGYRGRLVAAYENCLRILNLSDRSDPTTELIAKRLSKSRKLEEIGMSGGKGPV